MAYTFIKNNGGRIGDSIFEADRLNDCTEILSKAKNENVNVFLPEDILCSNEFSNSGLQKVTNIYEVPEGWQGLDIGPKTMDKFEQVILGSSTILWNGPMGVFEMPSFEKGTRVVAKTVAKATQNGAYSLIGGGDSVAAIKKFGLKNQVSFISTGGGIINNIFNVKRRVIGTVLIYTCKSICSCPSFWWEGVGCEDGEAEI